MYQGLKRNSLHFSDDLKGKKKKSLIKSSKIFSLTISLIFWVRLCFFLPSLFFGLLDFFVYSHIPFLYVNEGFSSFAYQKNTYTNMIDFVN